jgi:hypothetical protein
LTPWDRESDNLVVPRQQRFAGDAACSRWTFSGEPVLTHDI